MTRFERRSSLIVALAADLFLVTGPPAVIDYSPILGRNQLYQNELTGLDGRLDFMHFWFFSLLATPPLWIASDGTARLSTASSVST